MKKNLFTLVELMVVAIIVAILAAVAIPLMTGNVERAIITEANAALGSIRSNLRALSSEYGGYSDIELDSAATADTLGEGTDVLAEYLPNIKDTDLDGHYFSHDCYLITQVDDDTDITDPFGTDHNAPTFELLADGSQADDNVVPGADKVEDIRVYMYGDGGTIRSSDGGTNWEKVQ